MDWLKNWVRHNWWLKLLSLALAYALWVIVAQSPPVERGLSVPLELRNLPANLRVASELPTRIYVQVRGPESRLRQLSPGDLAVVVDLGGIAPGNHWVGLDAEDVEAPPGVEVIRLSPSELRLELMPR